MRYEDRLCDLETQVRQGLIRFLLPGDLEYLANCFSLGGEVAVRKQLGILRAGATAVIAPHNFSKEGDPKWLILLREDDYSGIVDKLNNPEIPLLQKPPAQLRLLKHEIRLLEQAEASRKRRGEASVKDSSGHKSGGVRVTKKKFSNNQAR